MSKRGNYCQWTEDDMGLALKAYRDGTKGLNQCSRDYNINKSTLLRHIRNTNTNARGTKRAMGRNPTFNNEIEILLVDHILQFSECLFGLSIRDVRCLAYDLAKKNKIPHQFSTEKKMAGKKWYYNFIKRHNNLSLRQPESTSLNRAKGFNKQRVYEYFDLLEALCDKHHLDATSVYNMDESGFSTVAKKCQKVLAKKGSRAVGGIASGERGVNTTIVCCVSAAGVYVPPMIIFKRKRYTVELSNGAPPGTKVVISDSGYITSELFVNWLQHFINFVHPTQDRKVLLLLDGHTTHCKNMEALILAKEYGITMIQLPGHTTHRLQPLDRSFFKPLEVHYTQAMEKWLREHVGRQVTQYQVAELLGEAYGRAATIQNAVNGFRATGTWPVNRYVFRDSDFIASDILKNRDTLSDNESSDDDIPLAAIRKSLQASKASTSSDPKDTEALSVSLHEISPLPVATQDISTRRKTGIQRAVELTSSPYRNTLAKKNMVAQSKKLKFNTDPNISGDAWFCSLCRKNETADMIRCMKCSTWFHCKCVGIKPSAKKFFCNKCKK